MITESLSFTVVQLRYVSACATSLAGLFKPDGKSPTQIGGLLTESKKALRDGLKLVGQVGTARGGFESAVLEGHNACVDVYAAMKSAYRKNPAALGSIDSLPVEDRTPSETLARMKAIAGVWASLPNAPGTNAGLTVREITAESFDDLIKDLDEKWQHYTNATAQLKAKEATLRADNEEWSDFVSAVLAQGRANYPEGTAGRALIDVIPTAPSTTAPGPAVITSATSPGPQAARLEFGTPHATSFVVFQKGPTDPDFKQVADVLLPGVYEANDLPEGQHQFKVVPENSRGRGPESAVSTVVVALAAAA